jgi:[ribosomal protein S18]-alanine N-acetyltransferase
MRESEKEQEPTMGPLLRPMETSDLPSVMEIDSLCIPRPWSEAAWRGELKSHCGLYLVLEEGGEIYGQIGVRHVSGELHITTLAVRPERRRQGHARTLMDAALAAFSEVRRVHLEVRPSNAAARTLYEALGFVTTGLRHRYYGDEDALLMTLDLGENRR